MAADRAASERKAAGERVRLAAFMAAQEAAAAAKRAAEAARLEAEQKFNKECIEVSGRGRGRGRPASCWVCSCSNWCAVWRACGTRMHARPAVGSVVHS